MSPSAPLFSVVVPAYQVANVLGFCLDSLLAQTEPRWEAIVVNDASTDHTQKVIDSYTALDGRIRSLQHTENQGLAGARNTGTDARQGRWVCFLDADDAYAPNHLDQLRQCIEANDRQPGLYFSHSRLFQQPDASDADPNPSPMFSGQMPLLTYLLRHSPQPSRWCIVPQATWDLHFSAQVGVGEDIYFLLCHLHTMPMWQAETDTVLYRVLPESMSRGGLAVWQKRLAGYRAIFSSACARHQGIGTERRRLYSMCHFHLSQERLKQGSHAKAWWHALRSWALFPASYNGKTNKIVLHTLIFSFPAVGWMLRKLTGK